MDVKYRYGHRPGRRRRTRVLIVLAVSLLVVGIVGAVVYLDVRKNRDSVGVEGSGRTIAQSLDEASTTVTLNEPFFSMDFPSDWKEISRVNSTNERSITWQASKRQEDNRYLKIYIDIIPKTYPVNRMLPVSPRGTGLSLGDVSNNCSTFTKGGLANAGQAQFLKDENARYQGVDFLCDLAQVTDNETGTSSIEGINTVSVTGPSKGKHSYFFVFIDHNIQPNSGIFLNILKSFKAK